MKVTFGILHLDLRNYKNSGFHFKFWRKTAKCTLFVYFFNNFGWNSFRKKWKYRLILLTRNFEFTGSILLYAKILNLLSFPFVNLDKLQTKSNNGYFHIGEKDNIFPSSGVFIPNFNERLIITRVSWYWPVPLSSNKYENLAST